jgi:Tol biopolymer transport system component/DNA-binding winged helix-turn-helix (wHTH) protein
MHDVPRFAFGDFELDTGRVQLLRGGRPLPLEPKAFAVLRLLVERAPHVVDKAEIFAVVWTDTAVTDNALTRIVAQLRKALGDDARDPRYIVTVSARGYRLLPAVRLVGTEPSGSAAQPPIALETPILAPPDQPGPLTPPANRAQSGPSRGRRPLMLVLGAGTCLAGLIGLGSWLASQQPPEARSAAPSLGDLDLAVAASLRPEQMTVATGFDGYVAYSPDGTSIAYSSDRSGALEIYVEGLAEGSIATSLTRGGGQCIQPAWSPDGRLIAYHDLAGDGIWVVPSRGGTARRISDVGAHPTWSPDGRRLAFQSRQPADLNPGGSFGAESTIWVADADGRTPPRALTMPGRPLGSHGMPQWWPGSERVVFAVSAPAGVFLGAALWTVDARSGEFRQLSGHARISSEFAVAPDGGGVLVIGRNTTTLWWLPVDAGWQAGEPRPTGLSVAGTSLASLAISPDLRRIAWTAFASNSGIWATETAGRPGAPVPIVPAAEIGWRAGHPAVAPDGRIAFVGNRGNAGNKIFLIEAGRNPRQLTTDARDHHSPSWVTGVNAIAALADHGDGMGWWLIDPATGRERFGFALGDVRRPAGVTSNVVGPAAGMSISPDFTRLAVAFVRDGVPNLWTADLGLHGPSGPFVQRTFEKESGAFASWSADGRWLAYQCTRGSSIQMCLVDAAAPPPAPVRQLTRDAGTNFNGEWIDESAFLVAGKRAAVWNVLRISATTGEATPLTAFVEPRFYVRYPRWDRARRRAVFERYETTGRLWSVQLPAVSAAGSPGSGGGH